MSSCITTIIRHWKTRTRLSAHLNENWVFVTNREGNLMFTGTRKLFDTCVARGWFELETHHD